MCTAEQNRGIGNVRVQMATRKEGERRPGWQRKRGKREMQERREREGDRDRGGEGGAREKGEEDQREREIESEGKRKTGSLVVVHRMRPVYVRSFALQT